MLCAEALLCRCATPGTSDNGCLSTGYGRICSTSGLKWPQRPLLQVPQPKLSPAVPSSLVTSRARRGMREPIRQVTADPLSRSSPLSSSTLPCQAARCRQAHLISNRYDVQLGEDDESRRVPFRSPKHMSCPRAGSRCLVPLCPLCCPRLVVLGRRYM